MMQESAPANPAISYLVGIGASAGGLEALQEFFQHMPADTQMAFVVIQHLSADYKSVMDELLQKQTAMAIKVVESPTTIEPNHIYLISSRSNLIIRKHALDVLEKDPAQRLNLPIDLFFHSLGEAYQERAVGIVLSGTGTDGSRGAKTIKENEGLVMVQQPEEARFDGMPNAIVSQGIADFVLPAAKLVAELARLAYHAPWLNAEQTLSENHGERMDPQLLRRILLEVKKQCKIDFTVYREQTILRRLNKRIRVLNLNSCEDYAAYLSSQAGEPRRLAREFMIGVTRFFRDEEAWELLRDRVLPELCASRNQDLPIRIWVAGCSSGEEAYSLAILLHEYLITHRLSLDFKLFATDIDEEAITFAGHGRYPESIFSSLSKERLYRYFDKEGDAYVIKKLIRDHIVFARHNLLTD
ncbi:MAG: histidine kinase, partial [Candidatus Melainabacteria bacterium HGW-Melainabacteria-1]